ncbi:hypothetical protein PAXRUDRAFT_824071 [Paxillus rubicundulus Ve08.2h10]|uniref:Unplaced genomic scaffold scaffold_79, whole genome shotgun sequence n=1 Tax=Paxillus rubicundulus Ve08.2h10 TaxID=930991 RepID=A0A0D0DUS0_9AGAM|nr:hypothetical protein PAXRUDRAFT_824071 [Paxillus rubicundulus Ve08.2h10]
MSITHQIGPCPAVPHIRPILCDVHLSELDCNDGPYGSALRASRLGTTYLANIPRIEHRYALIQVLTASRIDANGFRRCQVPVKH